MNREPSDIEPIPDRIANPRRTNHAQRPKDAKAKPEHSLLAIEAGRFVPARDECCPTWPVEAGILARRPPIVSTWCEPYGDSTSQFLGHVPSGIAGLFGRATDRTIGVSVRHLPLAGDFFHQDRRYANSSASRPRAEDSTSPSITYSPQLASSFNRTPRLSWHPHPKNGSSDTCSSAASSAEPSPGRAPIICIKRSIDQPVPAVRFTFAPWHVESVRPHALCVLDVPSVLCQD